MDRYAHLSETDTIIMEILWRKGVCGSAEIFREVGEKLNWRRTTVRTYLARLIEKKMVGTRQVNKRDLEYFPLVSREDYAADKSSAVIERWTGSLPSLVAGIVRRESISDQELDELEALIRNLRRQDKRKEG